jgi:hypothetical protein
MDLNRGAERHHSLSACPAGFDPEGGAPDELRTGLERQLLLEVFPVGFNRLDAQMKAFCDLAGALALADQAKHFEFAVGEHDTFGTAIKLRHSWQLQGETYNLMDVRDIPAKLFDSCCFYNTVTGTCVFNFFIMTLFTCRCFIICFFVFLT